MPVSPWGFLLGVQALMARRPSGLGMRGAGGLVLERLVVHLQRAACGPGCAAQRCALLVRGMIAKARAHDGPGLAPESGLTPESGLAPPSDPPPQSDSPSVSAPDGRGKSGLCDKPRFRLASPQDVLEQSRPGEPPDVEFKFLDSMLSYDAAFWEILTQDQPAW
ncbi:hypothetical protein C8R44DRAFT_746971 [Mycena epipterygia]|nr:hypothetical protein C8R44DRAFT_746971 [Mycena epipterygia]